MKNHANSHRLGDFISELATTYAEKINSSSLFTRFRNGNLSQEEYISLLCCWYPVVVTFPKALNHMIAKMDPVQHVKELFHLYAQAREEVGHNNLWRKMLECFGVNHKKLYRDFIQYRNQFRPDQWQEMHRKYIAKIKADEKNLDPQCYINAPFPEPVLALTQQQLYTSTHENFAPWVHWGSQYALECCLCNCVTKSMIPGLKKNERLKKGPQSVVWWYEHFTPSLVGSNKSKERKLTVEEKHIELGKKTFNHSKEAKLCLAEIVREAKVTLELMAAFLTYMDLAKNNGFVLSRYRKRAPQNLEFSAHPIIGI